MTLCCCAEAIRDCLMPALNAVALGSETVCEAALGLLRLFLGEVRGGGGEIKVEIHSVVFDHVAGEILTLLGFAREVLLEPLLSGMRRLADVHVARTNIGLLGVVQVDDVETANFVVAVHREPFAEQRSDHLRLQLCCLGVGVAAVVRQVMPGANDSAVCPTVLLRTTEMNRLRELVKVAQDFRYEQVRVFWLQPRNGVVEFKHGNEVLPGRFFLGFLHVVVCDQQVPFGLCSMASVIDVVKVHRWCWVVVEKAEELVKRKSFEAFDVVGWVLLE